MLDLFLYFLGFDHSVDLDDELVLHEHLDVGRRDLDHVVLRELELRLFLVLNHYCLLDLVVPLVEALGLVSELFVVDGRLLQLHGDLQPLVQDRWVRHIFVVNHVQRRLLVRVKQLDVKGHLQRADLEPFAIVDVLFVVHLKEKVNALEEEEHSADWNPLLSKGPPKCFVIVGPLCIVLFLEPFLLDLVIKLLDLEINLIHKDVEGDDAGSVLIVTVLVYLDLYFR